MLTLVNVCAVFADLTRDMLPRRSRHSDSLDFAHKCPPVAEIRRDQA
jgi:hypothetical protein